MTDRKAEAARADFDAKVDMWRDIYASPTFHDQLIADRLTYTLRAVDRLLPQPSGAAIDVGCGAGQLVVELARRGFAATGVDIAPEMVVETDRLIQQLGFESTCSVAEADALPVESGSQRLLTALGLIEYTDDIDAVLAEFHRVLEPGGLALVTSPNPLRIGYLADPLGVLLGLRRWKAKSYQRTYLTDRTLRRRLEGAGFRVTALLGHGFGPPAVAGRPVVDDVTAVRWSHALERFVDPTLARLFGSDLIAVAMRS